MKKYFEIKSSGKIYLLTLLILVILSIFLTLGISKDYFMLSETDNDFRNFMGYVVLAFYYLFRMIPLYFTIFLIWEIFVSSTYMLEISDTTLIIHRKYIRRDTRIPFSDISSISAIKKQDKESRRFIVGKIKIILKQNYKFGILHAERNQEQYFKEALDFFRYDPNLSPLVNLEIETVDTWKRVY